MVFLTVLAVIFICLVIYLLNVPQPPNTANPIKYKLICIFSKVLDDVSRLQAWWSGRDYRLVLQENMQKMSFSSRHVDPDVKVTEDIFDGTQVYIYNKHGTRQNRPALIYYHGGGFLFGHPVAYEALIQRFVKEFDMLVVAPRYRLSPKVKAPTHHEDCETATNYFFKNAEKFGVNPKLIGAAGDSAGGNLAASMCLMMRDQGRHQFAYQILIYPWTQGIDNNSPSRQRNFPKADRFLNCKSISRYLGSTLGVDPKDFKDLAANRHVSPETWSKYEKFMDVNDIPSEGIPPNYKPVRPSDVNTQLAERIQEDLTNPYVFPLCAENLSKLPPAFIMTVENDPVRDDGIWYAKRLQRAGVKVTHFHSNDGFHGMMSFVAPPVIFDAAMMAMDKIKAFLADFVE